MSQVTSHVLDTSKGKPAAGVQVVLYHNNGDTYTQIAAAFTDADGRVSGLLPLSEPLAEGNYKLGFSTGDYFKREGISSFYPWIDIVFTIIDSSHYHIPLLVSPFGYSSYRGS